MAADDGLEARLLRAATAKATKLGRKAHTKPKRLQCWRNHGALARVWYGGRPMCWLCARKAGLVDPAPMEIRDAVVQPTSAVRPTP